MKMIPESTIEQVIDGFENGSTDFESAMQDFAAQQPAVLSFLLSENEGALTDDERDYMLYIAIIIWKSIILTNPNLAHITPDAVAEAEEINWALLDSTNAKQFRDRLDIFFEDYPQEDLLAFAEDALTWDNEDNGEETFNVTDEGREPMFLALKTVIDVLTNSAD